MCLGCDGVVNYFYFGLTQVSVTDSQSVSLGVSVTRP